MGAAGGSMATAGRDRRPRSLRRRLLAAALLPSLWCCGGCTELVRYTDELVDARTGRTLVTRTPATFGGIVGFVVGLPVCVVVLPVTWAVYQSQSEAARDPISTYLFPSFVLWRVGSLLGMPFDAVEWVVWRGWQPESAMTPEERERREREIDAQEWTSYPVEPIYGRRPGG